jgi:hypothetical protein
MSFLTARNRYVVTFSMHNSINSFRIVAFPTKREGGIDEERGNDE